jgi:cytochrome c-type biogenesis protein CcmH/NrfG
MFRPDPNGGPHTVEEAVAKLTAMMKELPADSPRAKQLVGTIRRLQNLTERRGPLLP